jgi:uncharacterized membrane protein (GlpM family)
VSEVGLLGARLLAGGAFVVLFSLVSEVLKPKLLAGVFSAAPSVAVASLLVSSLGKGPGGAVLDAQGMLAGSAAMLVYCVLAVYAVRRFGALAGSGAAWLGWLAVAAVGYRAFLS